MRNALSRAAQTTARAATERVDVAVQRFLEEAGRPSAPTAAPFRPAASGPVNGSAEVAEPAEASGRIEEPGLRVLGQHRNTYIVATDGEELFLVDQHTAHERVRFERIEKSLQGQRPESQLLLSPVVVALPPQLLPLLEAQAESLAALGYDAELFGGSSVRLRSVPVLLAGRDPGRALESLLGDFRDRQEGDWIVGSPAERLAATLACHSSVRAGQALAAETMAAIVRDLRKTAHPALCPHGRPTSVRLPQEDVSRWVGRTGWKRQ